jgi:hypothetical protein
MQGGQRRACAVPTYRQYHHGWWARLCFSHPATLLESAHEQEVAVCSLYLCGRRAYHGSHAHPGRLWKWWLSTPAQRQRPDDLDGLVSNDSRSLASTHRNPGLGLFRRFACWNPGSLRLRRLPASFISSCGSRTAIYNSPPPSPDIRCQPTEDALCLMSSAV